MRKILWLLIILLSVVPCQAEFGPTFDSASSGGSGGGLTIPEILEALKTEDLQVNSFSSGATVPSGAAGDIVTDHIYPTKITNNNPLGGIIPLVFEVEGHNASQFEFWKEGSRKAYIESSGICHFAQYEPYPTTADLIFELGTLGTGFKFRNPTHDTLLTINDTGGIVFPNTNTRIGDNNGETLTGSFNNFFGGDIAPVATSSNSNTAFGNHAMYRLTTGDNNFAAGTNAGYELRSGSSNFVFGGDAGYYLNTGSDNIMMGYRSGEKNSSSSHNISFGNSSMRNNTGAGSVGIGNSALYWGTSGAYNSGLGHNAGTLYDGGNLTGVEKSLYLGAYTKAGVNDVTNETVIGPYAIGNGSNTVTLGNDDVTDTYTKGLLHIEQGIIDETASNAAKTVSATLLLTEYFVKVNSNDGSFTAIVLTLPPAASSKGKIYTIKCIDYQGTITIDGNASETIDDQLTKTLSAQYDAIRIQCDGTEWWIF